MRGRTLGVLLGMIGMLTWAPGAFANGELRSGDAMTKLGRGFVNIVTGWVEIPKRVSETSREQGTAAGWTWGLLRGLGHGFVRTAAGLYEAFTFPFPAPPDYAPVIQPEYVFSESSQ
jgi:putative exosortase-associated protein (TIGR04073 family)